MKAILATKVSPKGWLVVWHDGDISKLRGRPARLILPNIWGNLCVAHVNRMRYGNKV